MGLKRIMGQFETTFPADDARSLDDLTRVVADLMAVGVQAAGGTMARVRVLGAAHDPDPEGRAEDVVPPPPYDPDAFKGRRGGTK
jgi:hypothetical protein